MKDDLENKLLAVIRVRGRVGVRRSINETLTRLNLSRVNNLALLYGTKSNIGMIRKCNDFVTYGELEKETLEKVLERKKVNVNKEDLEGLIAGKKSARTVMNIPIRLHPPKHGYEGIKRGFGAGGALGYRGEKINELLSRMV